MIYPFFGRFHPLVVHIPIGVLIIAFLLEYAISKKKTNSSYAIEISLFIGSLSAILAAILGWILSLSGEYDEAVLVKHQWVGIFLCIASIMLWLSKKYSFYKPLFKKIYNPLFFLTMLLLFLTGHFGGSLTHGDDYLSYSTFIQEIKKVVPDSGKKIINLSDLTPSQTVYKDLINPVFDAKCVSCHNDKKRKGKFQMQSYELLLKGGKSGKYSVGAEIQKNELIKRIYLDKNEDKHMPPKGKLPLTQSEINLIYWWVNTGSDPDKKIIDVKLNDTVKAFLVNQDLDKKPELHLNKVPEAKPSDIEPFNHIHWQVYHISIGSPFLEVNSSNQPEFNDTHKNKLLKIAAQIAWLKLANTKINDVGMITIGNCSNIVKLNIQNTNITNESITIINQLQQLEYLNINGTEINDSGLANLKVNKSLKKIYCWKSKVTKTGIEKFKKLHPMLEIEFYSNE